MAMENEKRYTAAVITVSDKGFCGEREDVSGRLIAELLEKNGYEVVSRVIVPDERAQISDSLVAECNKNVALILTTGGTGFSKRDVTPEATADVIKKRADGITQAILYYALQKTNRAMLSRAIAGIRGDSLIINLPGSPKAVEEDLNFILPAIAHGLDILSGSATECAAKD